MKLLIDSADIEAIKQIYEYAPISGVTTNPTILKRAGKDPAEILPEIRKITKDDELHVQAIGETAEAFISDALAIRKALGDDVFVKIPATKEGFKAMKRLKALGCHITATAVYYLSQALFASQIGVDYIAPYYNRICLQGMDGLEIINKMKQLLQGSETKILAASFKTAIQAENVASLNIEAMTLSPDVYAQLFDHPLIDEVTSAFNSDFFELTGASFSMKDVLEKKV